MQPIGTKVYRPWGRGVSRLQTAVDCIPVKALDCFHVMFAMFSIDVDEGTPQNYDKNTKKEDVTLYVTVMELVNTRAPISCPLVKATANHRSDGARLYEHPFSATR